MTLQLRALAVLQEDLGSISSEHMIAHNNRNSSSGISDIPLQHSGAHGTYVVYRHGGKTLMHIK